MSNEVNKRTHCDCGAELPPPESVGGNWGAWRCPSPRCWFRYCQDCGSHLGEGDECLAYREAQDEEAARFA